MTDTIPEVPALAIGGAIAGEVSARGHEPAGGQGPVAVGNAWIDLRRNPMFWISPSLILLFVLMAAFPQLFTDKDPSFADLRQARRAAQSPRPGSATTSQGYDVYARTIYGARASILVGVLTTLVTLVFGSVDGHHRRLLRRRVDAVLSRIGDIFFAIPLLLGGDPGPLHLPERPGDALPGRGRQGRARARDPRLADLARLMRSSVLQVKPNDYVLAARALGASPIRIIRRTSCPTPWPR